MISGRCPSSPAPRGGRARGRRQRPALAALLALALGSPLFVHTRPATGEEATTPAAPLRSVGVVGDSIAKEADDHIRSVFSMRGRRLAHLDVSNGVSIDAIRARTVAAVTRPSGPDVLLLILGTAQANDIYWPFESTAVGRKWESDLRELLRATAPHVECVRVFDIQERKTNFYLGVDRHAREMNAATREVVTEFANVEYFHYKAWTDLTGPEYDWGDGLHHNVPGRAAMAHLIGDAADGCDPATSTTPFWDVRPTHWARSEIAWAAQQRLMSGYGNGSFRGEIGEFTIPVTRGQAISMLWRHAGRPAGAANHRWVDAGAWLRGPLNWAWSESVAAGFPGRRFLPDGWITRAELARMLWERAGAPMRSAPHAWVDGERWVDPALDWVAATRLMTGWPDGTFRPSRPISRAQAARLVFRFDQLSQVARPSTPEPPVSPPMTDAPTTVGPTTDTTTVATTAMTTAPPPTTIATTVPTAGREPVDS